ncbi:nuclear transport factor 2 family protein [Zobellia galactanivorans]|uniref:nuclear transport factor 2 family protein n=1 Tax=Zobellia TaxID=112040 RepID=UPI0026E35D29|nr:MULTISPECIES: nuclear transport factor 2 family protein [Zobellia]MDO6519119.1 nuclear transport factor 2 family protein [Zobellia uliginosa]MDO6809419.1 nuclear transport factor 2 family protein [Zobellia galactanivorans]
MTHIDIIKSTYEGKTSEENGKNLAKYVAEDVQWTEAKGFPYAGTYTGLEEITKNVFSRLGSEWIHYQFTPKQYVADGNTVIAIGNYTGVYKKTGKGFEARVAHLWTLKDSKIISFEQIVDSKTVTEAMTK